MEKLTEDNFATTVSNGIVLVKFGASWCSPCKMMDRILIKISDQYKSESNIKICHMDIDESPAIAQAFAISSVPTMIFVKDGVKSAPFVGIKAEKDIVSMLESLK